MERIDRILQHKRFQECRQQIMQAEVHRIYCKHGLEHSMDVARIAYILSLENNEEGQALEKEIIYAMALLHDLGRSMEYRNGQSHHEAGVEIAGEILRDCGFTETENAWITGAIAAHKYAETETVPEEPGALATGTAVSYIGQISCPETVSTVRQQIPVTGRWRNGIMEL